jgi:hypothetical protein
MAKKVRIRHAVNRFTDNLILQGRSGNNFQDELYILNSKVSIKSISTP